MFRRVSLTCGVAVVLLAVSMGWLQAELARRRAEASEARAIEAQTVADQRLDLANEAIAALLNDAADETFKSVPQMASVRAQFLNRSLAFYAELSTSSISEDEQSRFTTAIAHFRLGDVRRLLGTRDDMMFAETEYQAAIHELTLLSSEFPSNQNYTQQLARSYVGLGELFRIKLRQNQSELNYGRAIELQTDLVAAANDHQRVQYSIDLANAHMQRGISRKTQAHWKGALEDFDNVVFLLEELVELDLEADQDEQCRVLLAKCYYNQGLALQIADHSFPVRAKAAFVDAIDELSFVADRLLADQMRYSHDQARFHYGLAQLESDNGQLKDAAAHNAEAIRLYEQLNAGTPEMRLELAKAYLAKAWILDQSNRKDEAIAEFEHASNIVDSVRSQNQEDDSDATELLGLILLNKCMFYQQHGQHEDAITSIKPLIDLLHASLYLMAIDLMKKGLDAVDDPTLVKEYETHLELFRKKASAVD